MKRKSARSAGGRRGEKSKRHRSCGAKRNNGHPGRRCDSPPRWNSVFHGIQNILLPGFSPLFTGPPSKFRNSPSVRSENSWTEFRMHGMLCRKKSPAQDTNVILYRLFETVSRGCRKKYLNFTRQSGAGPEKKPPPVDGREGEIPWMRGALNARNRADAAGRSSGWRRRRRRCCP